MYSEETKKAHSSWQEILMKRDYKKTSALMAK
jgi:hypothetical protein